ncbi:MAG: FtsX-like permease family protein [Steroidobacteraceae bacterium]
MFRNCLAAAMRHLARNKLYCAISVFGLAAGLWAALLAGLVLRGQFSFDHFIPGYERIYVAMNEITPPGHAAFYFPRTNSWVGPQLKLAFSGIEDYTRLAVRYPVTLRHGAIEAREQIYWADPNAFEVLPLPTVAGDLKSALRHPDSIVLSRNMARKYFGRDAPLGETLLLDGTHPMTVSAVIENPPLNGTSLESEIFASGLASWSALSGLDRSPGDARTVSQDVSLYLRLTAGASAQRLLAATPIMARSLWVPAPQGWGLEFHLQRMDRLNSHPGLNSAFAGRVVMMLILGSVILIVACVNFVNLLTARSALRATEVAMRKVSGAPRHLLVLQFLGESLIYVAVAALVAVALTEWSLPFVNAFLGTGAAFDYWRDHALLGWIALAVLLIGLLAGAYPALVLSGFRPLTVLKGGTRHSRSAGLTRQGLVALQFAILIGLLIAAGVVYEQRMFATHEALRVDTDQMLLIDSPCNAAFAAELQKLRGVRGLACSSSSVLGGLNVFLVPDRRGVLQFLPKSQVESAFFKLYGIQVLAGDLPAEGSAAQGTYDFVNESAARRLGFASARAVLGFGLTAGNGPTVKVSAVVPDFNLGSVEQKVDARVYEVSPDRSGLDLISVRLTAHDIPETLAAIDRLWLATGGKQPIRRDFLDEHLQNLYVAMLREAEAFGIFSLLAVLLGCLGLLGLSASITERRTREIGIRKATGAATSDIVRLLLWQFAKPVLWANLIAWPVAGYIMNRWLHRFAYHTALQLWLFLAATAIAIAIALLTICTHTFLVARAKPIAALRYE